MAWPRLFALLTVLVFGSEASFAEAGRINTFGVGQKKVTFVDQSRGIKASGDFPGSDERRIDVIVWYPTDNASNAAVENAGLSVGGPWPLIVYAHGTMGYPDNATHFVEYLVKHGYIVVAPTFPLTSRASFTKITYPEMSDTPNQPGDVSFVIDRMLADETFGKVIDHKSIGCAGHSLGAITCYFSSFGMQTRDPRIVANAMIGAGDPVQAALASDFGFDGVSHARVSVPALFLSGERDVFAGLGGRPYAAYSRIEPPKFELMIKGGVHVWFRDGDEQSAEGKNPDCLFFEKNLPGAVIPGCDARGGLIEPELQRQITREALRAFFDAYLKEDSDALARLRDLGETYKEAQIIYQD